MKILVVLTGGTIGSSVLNGVADVDEAAAESLAGLYENDSGIEFDFVSPFNILSENADCETLSQICSFMLSVDFKMYDGVIITHGSDTLSFTSSVLGLVLSWVEIPIVITAANYVLSSPKSNGQNNFVSSVDFIREFQKGEHSNTGVFVIWKNDDEDTNVYISTRLIEADGYLDSFCGWGGVPFGKIKNGTFERIESKINPTKTAPNPEFEFLRGKNILLKNSILLLGGYVGMDFDSVNIRGKKAVLFKLYHSATACSRGESTSFLKFAERCFESGVDVYVYSAKKTDYIYKSAEAFSEGNIIPMYNINTSSAYAKLLLSYALGSKEILNRNIFFEILD